MKEATQNSKPARVGLIAIIATIGLLISLVSVAQPRQRRAGGGGPDGAGQHERGPKAMIGQMQQLLDLTENQVAAIESVFENQREIGRENRAAHRANAEALKAALEQDSPDATAVGELLLAGKELRAASAADREELQGQVNAVLTDEQQATWEGFQKGRRGARGDDGKRGTRRQRGPRGGGQGANG